MIAAQVIQRYFRRVVARRYRLTVGWKALKHLRFKAYRWVKLARIRIMHEKIEMVKQFLRDWRSQRSIQQVPFATCRRAPGKPVQGARDPVPDVYPRVLARAAAAKEGDAQAVGRSVQGCARGGGVA
eukprot:3677628-Rhodomonas_salina.3